MSSLQSSVRCIFVFWVSALCDQRRLLGLKGQGCQTKAALRLTSWNEAERRRRFFVSAATPPQHRPDSQMDSSLTLSSRKQKTWPRIIVQSGWASPLGSEVFTGRGAASWQRSDTNDRRSPLSSSAHHLTSASKSVTADRGFTRRLTVRVDKKRSSPGKRKRYLQKKTKMTEKILRTSTGFILLPWKLLNVGLKNINITNLRIKKIRWQSYHKFGKKTKLKLTTDLT